MPILLQAGPVMQNVVDSLKNVAADALTKPKVEENLFSLLFKGGWIMIPLALFLIVAIFIFIERFLAIRKIGKTEDNFMNIIRDNIVNGNVPAAKAMAANNPSAIGKMITKGIQRIGKPIDSIEKSMEAVGKLQLYKMEKNLKVLSVISSIAPMFGFLGTIIGMVQLFVDLSQKSSYDTSTVAGGIYTKLITSSTGLIIGILAYLAYNILQSKIEKATNAMENASAEFLDVLQEPTR
jgi:biopolymer transport protein ExbB